MFRIYILLLLACILVFGCGGSDQETAGQPEPEAETALSPDEQLYVEAADSLVAQFVRSLQSQLLSAAGEGNYSSVLNVCNVKAPELTGLYTGGGWSLRRVSDRFRSANNRPDTLEQSFLASFADTAGQRSDFIADWRDEDTTKIFRFYKPIETKSICLNCHGDLQTISSDTYRRIKKLYPMDRATGFKVGDLRGMFVVEAHWPEGNEMAERIVSGELAEELNRPIDSLLDSMAVDSMAIDSLATDSTLDSAASDSSANEE